MCWLPQGSAKVGSEWKPRTSYGGVSLGPGVTGVWEHWGVGYVGEDQSGGSVKFEKAEIVNDEGVVCVLSVRRKARQKLKDGSFAEHAEAHAIAYDPLQHRIVFIKSVFPGGEYEFKVTAETTATYQKAR